MKWLHLPYQLWYFYAAGRIAGFAISDALRDEPTTALLADGP